jgi:hypothetical protein
MRALLLALLLFCGSTHADEVILHLGSYHTNRTYEFGTDTRSYNNENPGLAYRRSDGWAVGAYWNSYKKTTVYIAKEMMFTEHFGIEVGVGTGYRIVSNKVVMPIGAFVYKIPLSEDWHADVLMLPPIGSQISGVAHVALAKKF